jgi:ParB-like chromosome segregation protein Spo0J
MTRHRGDGHDAVFLVPVDSLRSGTSPRLSGEDPDHVRVLAESFADLPPITVHRETMRVIDGVHRLRAARLRNQRQIRVHYFTGTEEEAFVLAVRANTSHGLPLTSADRRAAARRIIAARPEWSDRRVGAVAGLSGPAVAALRKRVLPASADAGTRVGRDGRARPLNSCERRLVASQLIKDRPHASVREIARTAGIAPSTALDVRNRVRQGVDPVPHQTSRKGRDVPSAEVAGGTVMAILRRDPSLRFTDGGRVLLRWLEAHTVGAEEWPSHADRVPEHCAKLVAVIARNAGRRWLEFADQLEAGQPTAP